MYTTLTTAILSGGYRLPEMTKKIDTLWAAGRLTDEERETLQKLALEHCTVDTERPEVLQMLEALAARVTALEALHAEPDSGGYPEWKPWDGLSKDYQYGAIVNHNGKLWINTYDGQNIWEPGAYGWAE